MLTEAEIVSRLVIAALFGAVVGLERERHNQPAGLRTHTILAIGAALSMCLSIDLAMQFRDYAPNGDPARLAAQVISGIGFLGGGAIIRYGKSIKGLTTATSLWTVASVGLAVGAGHLFSAFTATVLVLAVLVVLDKLEKLVVVGVSTRSITIEATDHPRFIAEIRTLLTSLRVEPKEISFRKQIAENAIVVKVVAKIRDQENLDRLMHRLSEIPGCASISVE